MNFLDIRTVLFSYAISNAISVVVMFSLWRQNRTRSPELILWLADFVLLFLALLTLFLRGILPDALSIMLGYPLTLTGTLLLYVGLQRYTGKRSSQWHNVLLLAVFIAVQAYYTFVQPNLQARDIAFTLVLLIYHAQCAWLVLYRVEPDMRPATRLLGLVWLAYILVSLVKLLVALTGPQNQSLFASSLYETLLVLCYQMLTISLTFALVLMVNRRLLTELETDIGRRIRVEAALKQSEEKFAKAFQNSPDVVVLTSLPDGKIIETNESFTRITEFSIEESLGKTTVELNLWEDLADRERYLELLRQHGRVQNFETQFRRKSGEFFAGWISGETIEMQRSRYVISVIHDITERKNFENALLIAKQQADAANRQLQESLAREEQMSRTDRLTGVLNRGRFFELAVTQFEDALRCTQPLTILMFDIDHFKLVNDEYGHPAGDVVLREIAQTVAQQLRPTDVLGRYGGEEFIVLLPVTDTEQALPIGKRLLDSVRALRIEVNQGMVQVTISVGLATLLPGDESVERVIDRADRALYRAKQGGRNRIVVEA